MSSADIAVLVENFPSISASQRAQLLDFARTTPLTYGPWKPFKALWKKAEAQTLAGNPDVELLGALIFRIDDAQKVQPNFHWSATNETTIQGKRHTASYGSVTCTVGARRQWDSRGWRVLVSHQQEANSTLGNLLRRAIGTAKGVTPGTAQAFDFESRNHVYHEVKKVEIIDGVLKVHCNQAYYGNRQPDTIYEVNVADPNFIFPARLTPSSATFGYMKRRTRRLLRRLSAENSALYIQVVVELLRACGDSQLDPRLQWSLMDVLLGASPRWGQSAHGRGGYVCKTGFVRMRREECAQSVWDAHLDVARGLFGSDVVPAEANEMALKILRAHGETNFVLATGQAQRFWKSQSPVLQSLAARHFRDAWQRGEAVDGATWAGLVVASNAATRRALHAADRLPRDSAWRKDAVKTLEGALASSIGSKARRAAESLLLHFDEHISAKAFWQQLPVFIALGSGSEMWVAGRVRSYARTDLQGALNRISEQPEALQADLMTGIREEVATRAFTAEEALPFVAGTFVANRLGWELLASSAMTPDAARDLWRRVWKTSSWFASEVHRISAQSDAALKVFQRATFVGEEIESWIDKAPAFFSALSPAFFVETFRLLTPRVQVERVLVANEAQWKAAREVLLKTLQEPATLGAFWNRVLEDVKEGANAALQSRILDDEEISASFVRIDAETIEPLLERTDPAHEEFLVRWLDANMEEIGRGDAALLFAAIHPINTIRERGLQRLESTGLDLPLALRLMESELPQPFAAGRLWFENNTDVDEADAALALCDSPEASVRAFGRQYLESRHERILSPTFMQKLGENADPLMQAWLAEKLLQNVNETVQSSEVKAPDMAQFDLAVLRTRGKSRRAKEAVKTRRDLSLQNSAVLSMQLGDDVEVLLEMARSRTTRDRDWALQQLAQLALAGQEIDGVALGADSGEPLCK